MFSFNVLTWNACYGGGNYSKSLNRALFGGSPGHSAAELIIPITPENSKLLDEVNNNGMGNLKVKETTTLISHPTDSKPFYEMIKVPSYKIYFSFWGDLTTKKTDEGHRMLDYIRDSIEEGKGIPVKQTPKGFKIFKDCPQEWHGLISSTTGQKGIEYQQNLTGLSIEQIQASRQMLNRLRKLERDKDIVLQHVKEISAGLKKLKTEKHQQNFLQSKRVKLILEMRNLETFDQLKLKLSSMSATMEQLRDELVCLGVSFGSPPDVVVSFPFNPYQKSSEFGLNYQEILREMGRIANSRVPYHARSMNCCTTALQVVRAGVTPQLEEKLKKVGYSLPTSNLLFETPQSVYDYSLKLNSILFNANHNIENNGKTFSSFESWMNNSLAQISAKLFPPNEKNTMLNQRAENKSYLIKSIQSLQQLEVEFKKRTIDKRTYEELKRNALGLIDIYRGKVKDIDQQLLTKGYISRTNEHNEQIKASLVILPFAQKNNILKLDSDDKIVMLIDKISSDIYSNLQEHEIYGDIKPSEITKQVAAHVEEIINPHRIQVDRFDYQSLKSTLRTKNLANKITVILEKKHQSTKIPVDVELAAVFLRQYQLNCTSLSRLISNLQKRNKNCDQAIIDLSQQQEAIELIKSAQESANAAQKINIFFPPSNFRLKDLNQAEMQLFCSYLKSNPHSGDANTQMLHRNLNALSKLQKILTNDLKNITPNYYCFEHIEKVRSSFATGFIGNKSANDYIAHLAKNLISHFELHDLMIPLTTEARDAVVAIINFHKYLERDGGSISNLEEVREILNAYPLKQLTTVLEESETINIINKREQQNTQPSLLSKHLTKDDHRFIHLFHKIVTRKQEASYQEKMELSILIEKSIGNLDLNKRISLFEKENHPLLKKYFSTHDMKYFMFKTAKSEINDSLLAKAQKAIQAVEEGTPLQAKERLTLFELGRLDDLCKMHQVLEEFQRQGLLEPSRKLKKLYRQASHSKEMMSVINKKVSDEHLLESGDIMMNHSKKSLALKNKKADQETMLTQTFISKYSHAAQVFIDPDNELPKLSHIWGEHQINEVKPIDLAISDTFRVNPIRLIPPNMLSHLKEHYGEDNYEREIRKLFKNNVQQLLAKSQQRFSKIKNNKSARFRAGWADYGVYGGHKASGKVDRTKEYCEMYGKEGLTIKNDMICSEFVAKSVVASIYETNEQLKTILLSHHKMSFRGLESKDVMRIPMQQERLERVHPKRLIKLLEAEGCLELIPNSAFLSNLLRQTNPYSTSYKSVESPGIIFYKQIVNLAKTTPVKESFVQKALECFRTLSQNEALEVDLDNLQMQSFLTEHFCKIHEQVQAHPKGVLGIVAHFFKSLAEFFGHKEKSKAIIEKIFGNIEKIHVESLKMKGCRNIKNIGSTLKK